MHATEWKKYIYNYYLMLILKNEHFCAVFFFLPSHEWFRLISVYVTPFSAQDQLKLIDDVSGTWSFSLIVGLPENMHNALLPNLLERSTMILLGSSCTV